MTRANWVPAPHFFELNLACRALVDAYGAHVYLVGSAIARRDYRDVDVRMILPDADFASLFPGLSGSSPSHDARWSLLCSAISLWLSKRSGLPVDFQIQQMTEANSWSGQSKGHPRHPLGLFYETHHV